jgi:hypothetical protein
MRVGITGHQQLDDPEAWPWVAAALRAELVKAASPLVGVTSLAVGADQLLAQLVLERGGTIHAVLPFADIERSFLPEHLPAYRELVRRATVEVLNTPGTDEDAYLAAGRRVVDLSDMVLAVWDGAPQKVRAAPRTWWLTPCPVKCRRSTSTLYLALFDVVLPEKIGNEYLCGSSAPPHLSRNPDNLSLRSKKRMYTRAASSSASPLNVPSMSEKEVEYSTTGKDGSSTVLGVAVNFKNVSQTSALSIALSLVVTRGLYIYEELVALTGIERVGCQFSTVQFSLSV